MPRFSCILCALVLLSTGMGCKKDPSGPSNLPPQIRLRLETTPRTVFFSEQQITIAATIEDEFAADSVTVMWFASAGTFVQTAKETAVWQAPTTPGTYTVRATAIDEKEQSAEDSIRITTENRAPVILSVTPDSAFVILGNLKTFSVAAQDSDGNALTYSWQTTGGRIVEDYDSTIVWQAPEQPGRDTLFVTVTDDWQSSARDTATVVVYREAGSAWVADTGNHEVVKISGEGKVIFRQTGFYAPVAIALDAPRRRAWVIDNMLKKLVRLDIEGMPQAEYSDLGGPVALDLVAVNGHVWIAEADSNRISEVSNDGVTLVRRVNGFLHPGGLVVDQRSGDIYVADTGAHRVVRVLSSVPNGYSVASDSGYHELFNDFDAPVALAADLHNREIWVVDKFIAAVNLLQVASRTKITVSGLRLPEAITFDNTLGIAWIADTGNGRIVKVSKNGLVSQVTGFRLPQDLSVDPNDGSVWIADTENDRIVKVSANGDRLFELYGFSSPQGIRVNPGQ